MTIGFGFWQRLPWPHELSCAGSAQSFPKSLEEHRRPCHLYPINKLK